MSKIFQSRVDASFFNYISKIWDRLPQEDRDLLVEYWRGLIRATSDEYLHYLQVEANNGLLSINPYEVRKWREIKFKRDVLNDLKSTSSGFSLIQNRASLTANDSFGGKAYSEISPSPNITGAVWYKFSALTKFNGPEEFFIGLGSEGRKIGISLGYLSPTSLSSSTDLFIQKFSVRKETEGTLLGKVISNRSALQGTLPDDLIDLVTQGIRVAVVLYDPNTSDFDVVEVKNISSDRTSVVFMEQVSIPDNVYVSGTYYVITKNGISSYGSSPSTYFGSALQNKNTLIAESFIGGQVGLFLSEESYITTIELYLSSVSDLNVPFDIYYSPTNGEGSWDRISPDQGLLLEPISGEKYVLRLSDLSGVFVEPGWIKIIPRDPTLSWQFSSSEFFPILPAWNGYDLGGQFSSWSSSGGSPSAKYLEIIDDKIFLSTLPVSIDFSLPHSYKFEYLDEEIKVSIDNQEITLTKDISKSGISASEWTIEYFRGGSQSKSSLVITEFLANEFEIDPRIAELPALYDRYEFQELVLEEEEDYVLENNGNILFLTLNPFNLEQDFLVAEYVSYSGRRLEGIYGKAVDVYGEDSPQLKNKIVAIWGALLEGPLIQSLQKGIHAILGLPITLEDGFVTGTPTEDSIEIDGKVIKFPAPVGVATNPRTGELYKEGDFVPAFSILAGGVQVRDYVSSPGWWYGRKFSGVFNELQKYHTFEVEIDDSLVTPGSLDEIKAFLDRIRKLGDNFFALSSVSVKELLVLESNKSRANLLSENRDLIFVGDSSDPAIICTPPIWGRIIPNLLGDSIFGSLSSEEINNQGLSSLYGAEDAGFGADVSAYLNGANEKASGTANISGLSLIDASATFISDSVSENDLVELNGYLVLPIGSVISETEIGFPSVSAASLNELSSPVSYRILESPYSFAVDSQSVSYFVESNLKVPEGAVLEIEADGEGSSFILVGTKPNYDDGSWPSYSAEELLNNFLYSNNESRIIGATPFTRKLGIDLRDLPPLELPPEVFCIKTDSKKGFNSFLTIHGSRSDAHLYLGFAEGDTFGRVTYPGLEHVTFDGSLAKGEEPNTAAAGGNGPYLETERSAQLSGWVKEPGLEIVSEINVIDGITIRDDLRSITGETESYLAFVDGNEQIPYDLTNRTLYQIPISGRSQFATFHVDYISPVKPYFIKALLSEAARSFSLLPDVGNYSGGEFTFISGSGTLYPDGKLLSQEEFLRTKVGQTVEIQNLGTGNISEILDANTILISGLPNVNSATQVQFFIKTVIEVGDYLYLRRPDLSSIFSPSTRLKSGEILVVSAYNSSNYEVSLSRINFDGSLSTVPSPPISPFSKWDAYLIKPFRPFSNNWRIHLGRTGRTNESVVFYSDDIRFMEDSVEITNV